MHQKEKRLDLAICWRFGACPLFIIFIYFLLYLLPKQYAYEFIVNFPEKSDSNYVLRDCIYQ